MTIRVEFEVIDSFGVFEIAQIYGRVFYGGYEQIITHVKEMEINIDPSAKEDLKEIVAKKVTEVLEPYDGKTQFRNLKIWMQL